MDLSPVAKFASNLSKYPGESAGDSYYCSDLSMSIKGTPLYVVTVLLTGFIVGTRNKNQKSRIGPRALETSTSIFIFFFDHTFRQEWFIRTMIPEFFKGI